MVMVGRIRPEQVQVISVLLIPAIVPVVGQYSLQNVIFAGKLSSFDSFVQLPAAANGTNKTKRLRDSSNRKKFKWRRQSAALIFCDVFIDVAHWVLHEFLGQILHIDLNPKLPHGLLVQESNFTIAIPTKCYLDLMCIRGHP